MSFQYTLAEVNKMGENDPTYGQTYWTKSTEEIRPLKFNSRNTDITVGMSIIAEETVNKRSTKGIDYLQLKKVQVLQENPSEPRYVAQEEAPSVGYDKFKQQGESMQERVASGPTINAPEVREAGSGIHEQLDRM